MLAVISTYCTSNALLKFVYNNVNTNTSATTAQNVAANDLIYQHVLTASDLELVQAAERLPTYLTNLFA